MSWFVGFESIDESDRDASGSSARCTDNSYATVDLKRLNIAARIWLSIGIFILGFLISMGLQQAQGIETERTLRITSEVLFPAAQMSQDAEAGFHRAIKNFSDAVLTQDSEALRRASEDG